MTVRIGDVEIGDDLPTTTPDVSLSVVRQFVRAATMDVPRFTDHEEARRQGLPGALVPGVMSQAQLAVLIHTWAPGARIRKIDTVFRSPVIVGSRPTCTGVITDVDLDHQSVEVDLTIVDDNGITAVLGTAVVELDE